ncbi:MAG: alcohol dehydrogenase catalytic domain-containing protein [Fimbriimonadaceae bacterium]
MSSIPKLMRAARFHKGGEIRVDEVPVPACPTGGLLVRSLACGLCSGELMGWYMERKAERGPHVLGHEVVGIIVESQDERFPVGVQVSPHHHAPCFECEYCRRGAFVHCATWRSTRLDPGGMAEYFAVSKELLGDCPITEGLDIETATLVEPLACVAKQLRRLRFAPKEPSAVVGLGVMGLLHALVMPGCVGYEINDRRREWAESVGVDCNAVEGAKYVCVVLCPGSVDALEFAAGITDVGGRVGLFAPLTPGNQPFDFEKAYMHDIEMINSYSCGPDDTALALQWLKDGRAKGEQVISDRISLDELPEAYKNMKNGEILKPVVIF